MADGSMDAFSRELRMERLERLVRGLLWEYNEHVCGTTCGECQDGGSCAYRDELVETGVVR